MTYTKSHDPWIDGLDGTRIDAADLNNIEAGIAAAHTALDGLLVQVGTLTLPASPVTGQNVTVLADSTTILPEGVTWDSGGEPTVTDRLLISLVWSGTDWVGTYGPSIPAYVAPPIEVTPTGPTWTDDATNGGGTWTTPTEAGVIYSPASGTADPDETVTVTAAADTGYALLGTTSWQHAFPPAPIPEDTIDPTPGTLTDSAHTSSGFTLTVTGASDAGAGLHAQPYRFSTDSGTTWTAWQTAASYSATGLAASTAYTCLHEVRDKAGNTAQGVSITATTGAASAGVIASDDFNRANGPLIGSVTSVGALTWVKPHGGTGVININSNQAHISDNNVLAVVDVGTTEQKVSVKLAGSAGCGVALRADATDTGFYRVVAVAAQWYIVAHTSMASPTVLAQWAQASEAGDILTAQIVSGAAGAATITVWRNDTQVRVHNITSGARTGTHAGIWGIAGAALDDFVAEAPE